MKRLSRILSAASLAVGVALAGVPAGAQQPAAPPLKLASPAAIAAAKEILAMKNASAMYANAVPNIVQQTKDALLQSNLNYQKDLNEVAVIVAQSLAGREKEIGEGMAKVYANEFTGQELKALDGAPGNSVQHGLYESVDTEFCRNGQRTIPRRDAQTRQGDIILGSDFG